MERAHYQVGQSRDITPSLVSSLTAAAVTSYSPKTTKGAPNVRGPFSYALPGSGVIPVTEGVANRFT